MKKLLAFAFSLFLIGQANAANVDIPALPAASSVAGTSLFECSQVGTSNKCTAAQTAAYVYGLMSGDATTNGTGTFTLATVNSNVGSFGSSTQCASVTVNAKGLITAASAVNCAPPFSAVTGRATLSQIPQLSANSIFVNPTGSTADAQSIAVPACANDGSHALVYVNGTGLQCASISVGGTGTVTSVSAGCGTSTGGSPITTTGTLSAAITKRVNSTTSDTIVSTDCGNLVQENNASSIAVSIAQAGTTGFGNGAYFSVCNIGVGTATITPTTSTIGGASNYALPGGSAAAPKCVGIQSDGTNYNVVPDWFAVGALATVTPGTGVATAAAVNLSAAGGLTSTIASGTAALGTSAIASGACATVVTVSATNVATTDVVMFGYNSDPTAVTGYGASGTGAVLSIYPYPTANNVNVKVCNSSSASITPGAMTLNWRVVR